MLNYQRVVIVTNYQTCSVFFWREGRYHYYNHVYNGQSTDISSRGIYSWIDNQIVAVTFFGLIINGHDD